MVKVWLPPYFTVTVPLGETEPLLPADEAIAYDAIPRMEWRRITYDHIPFSVIVTKGAVGSGLEYWRAQLRAVHSHG
jgi:hypothetical protein